MYDPERDSDDDDEMTEAEPDALEASFAGDGYVREDGTIDQDAQR